MLGVILLGSIDPSRIPARIFARAARCSCSITIGRAPATAAAACAVSVSTTELLIALLVEAMPEGFGENSSPVLMYMYRAPAKMSK